MNAERRAPELARAFASRRCQQCGGRHVVCVKPGNDGIKGILPSSKDENRCLSCITIPAAQHPATSRGDQ